MFNPRAYLASLLIVDFATSSAQAAFYATTTPPAWYGWSLNPLSGAYSQGINTTSYPIGLAFNGPNISVSLNAGMTNPGTNFALAGTSSTTLTLFSSGVTIDALSTYSNGTGISYSAESAVSLDSTTPYFIGFRYSNQGAGNNETYYGWAKFTTSPGMEEDELTLTEFGVGGDGQGVITGSTAAIPEPSTTGLMLAACALGASLTMRRARTE